MGIFANIMSKIFHKEAQPPSGTSHVAANDRPSGGSGAVSGQTGVGTAGGLKPASMPPVDVEAVLTSMANKSGQKLDWRKSIVDLMKLLGLDSSQNARKELAKELNYSGDMNDSAKMNMWLHKQVMRKLAENGGKVPDDLKS
jgi:hypothetical protein